MEDGRTGLHISAESGNVAVLRQLLENGADPTLEDKVGGCWLYVKNWSWTCVTSLQRTYVDSSIRFSTGFGASFEHYLNLAFMD